MSELFIYDVPSDKVTGTWSQTGGTVNSLYPLANIDDGKPWNPTVFTANPSRIICDHGTPKRLEFISFYHCNFPATYGLHVQRGNVIGTALQDVAVTCPGPFASGHPSNPYADLSGTGVGSYQYTWLELPVTATLLSLGLVRLTGTKRSIAGSRLHWGIKAPKTFPLIERATDADTQLGYSRGTRARRWSGALMPTDAAFAILDAAFEECLGRLKPFMFVLDPNVNEAAWVKWGPDAAATFLRTYTFLNLNDLPLDLEEVGRGLRP